MVDTSSPNLGLDYVVSQQASPEITVNSAFNMIEALMIRGVLDQQDAPPGSPADGALYLVGIAGSGAWAGHDNAIAGFYGGTWVFIPGLNSVGSTIAMGEAQAGLTVYNVAIEGPMTWDGATWQVGAVMPSSVKADLPAATGSARWIYVTDAAGGAVPAFNNGSNWLRCDTSAVIS